MPKVRSKGAIVLTILGLDFTVQYRYCNRNKLLFVSSLYLLCGDSLFFSIMLSDQLSRAFFFSPRLHEFIIIKMGGGGGGV